MVPKPCEMPKSIIKYQALIRRLAENHIVKFDVATDFNNRMTGFRGEESVMNFHLDPLLNSSNYRIYHDLRFLHGNYYFQIDILILCSYFALVLEVKNRARDWHFDKVIQQTILEKDGKKERTKNPIFQARLQAYKLKEWLKEHNFSGLPIQYLFVNSNETAKIFIEEDNKYKWNVCHSESLLERIEQKADFFKVECFEEKELRKINKLLLSNNCPEEIELFQKYSIGPKDVLPGVHCPNCNYLPMIYYAGTWKCPKCRTKSKTAYIDTLRDYFLLINPSITNAEARRFLQTDSPKIAHHILTSMNLPTTGNCKYKVYHQQ
jgi:hypothetical protein